MRQWRWQYYCRSLPEIVRAAGDPELEREHVANRRKALTLILEELERSAGDRLKNIVSDVDRLTENFVIDADLSPDDLRYRLSTALKEGDLPERRDVGKELTDAYGNVRIGAQERYANYITGKVGRFSTHPRIQKMWLGSFDEVLLVLILGVHFFVTIMVLIYGSEILKVAVDDLGNALKIFHTLAVLLALTALAVRAVEDGLRPSEHLGRYLGYAAETRSIRDNFNAARTPELRAEAMLSLERASYEEMVDFLKAGHRSRYVI